jgi:hypothetical protein
MFKAFAGIVVGWTAGRALDKTVKNPITPPTIAEIHILIKKASDAYEEIAKK